MYCKSRAPWGILHSGWSLNANGALGFALAVHASQSTPCAINLVMTRYIKETFITV